MQCVALKPFMYGGVRIEVGQSVEIKAGDVGFLTRDEKIGDASSKKPARGILRRR